MLKKPSFDIADLGSILDEINYLGPFHSGFRPGHEIKFVLVAQSKWRGWGIPSLVNLSSVFSAKRYPFELFNSSVLGEVVFHVNEQVHDYGVVLKSHLMFEKQVKPWQLEYYSSAVFADTLIIIFLNQDILATVAHFFHYCTYSIWDCLWS